MRFISVSEHLLALSGTGLVAMGIMNWIGDDDSDSGEPEDVSADGGDDLFGEMDSGDDFGGMDDDFGDDFGGMDDDFGDDFGGGGMGGTDDFGGGGGGGNQLIQDMENRVDGLENEVAEISSTINTVRSENEEISESVDEIEENVRKLLEIYEMVTRGVNPFVDDVQDTSQMGGSAFGGDFGLFDDDDASDGGESEEDVDDDVMDADAESFFDDDALDDFEADDEDDEFEAETDEELDVDLDGEADSQEDTESSASSFQELKAEYESGEADWAEGSEEAAAAAAAADNASEFELEDEEEEDNLEIEVELDDGEPADDESSQPVTVEDEFEFDEAVEEPPASNGSRSASDEKPYLESLPGGYVVDLVVMEWLEFLIGEFSAEEAVRTIEYYKQIDWISEPVSDDLHSFLEGLADIERDDSGELGPIELDIDDHLQSLTFISQLTGDSIQRKIVDHCAQIRGEDRGIQR